MIIIRININKDLCQSRNHSSIRLTNRYILRKEVLFYINQICYQRTIADFATDKNPHQKNHAFPPIKNLHVKLTALFIYNLFTKIKQKHGFLTFNYTILH